jgi:hypothetical protein
MTGLDQLRDHAKRDVPNINASGGSKSRFLSYRLVTASMEFAGIGTILPPQATTTSLPPEPNLTPHP